jgi:serine/threonine-protein kinase
VSRGGALAYVDGRGERPSTTLVWVDRAGREESVGAPPRNYIYPRLSPDGTRIALDVRDADEDIWIWDVERTVATRLTSSPRGDYGPVWSPDGRMIFYSSVQEDGGSDLFRVRADGAGEAVRLTEQGRFLMPEAVTADGSRLIADSSLNRVPPFQIVEVDAKALGEPRTLLADRFNTNNPELSPDGRWLAYMAGDIGREEVFVRPFPAVESGLWQVSGGGGSRPAWSRDGGEIFYLDPAMRLMGARAETHGDALILGQPEVVIEAAYPALNAGRTYDVSPDGRRFLMIKGSGPATADASGRIVLVQGWLDELRRLAPPGRRSRSAQEESVR